MTFFPHVDLAILIIYPVPSAAVEMLPTHPRPSFHLSHLLHIIQLEPQLLSYSRKIPSVF